MKLFKNFALATLALGQSQEGSANGAMTASARTLDFSIDDKSGPLDDLGVVESDVVETVMRGAKVPVSIELTEPLYQECEAPAICGTNIPARCRNMGESCAQTDPVNNPCDYHCVSQCPPGQDSIIVTGASGGKFKKCTDIAEIRQMSNFICSSPEGKTPQFEMQVPKIMRHKYLPDERNYTLVPFYNEEVSFDLSNCVATEETEHFIIFRGSLEAREECQINHWIEYEDAGLFDVYTATVGYDDLTGPIGNGQTVVYRKGAHYQFECRVKQTATVTNDVFPFVDGRRPVTVVHDETETQFEMVRCTDSSCTEVETNGVIDISPDSLDDPMVWFKVEALTQGRYAHLRQCYYSFDNGTDDFERFDVIQNGCSANQPITVLNQTRQSMSYDVFGQVMFMHQDFDTTKVRISCIVDACLPPTLGVFSCEVESACAGRYDQIYEQFKPQQNDVMKRKRRGQRSTVINEEAIVEFEIYHPCYLINTGQAQSVCPKGNHNLCWTRELCQAQMGIIEKGVMEPSSAASIYGAVTAFLLTLLL